MKIVENNQYKSSHGGARKGAGRKPGAATKKTREIADRAASEGITPLEVMLEAMRDAYEAGDAAAAFNFARDAAPYVHPKMSAIEHAGDGGGPVKYEITNIIIDPQQDDQDIDQHPEGV